MSSGMASYVLSKQEVLLTDAQVTDIVNKIEAGRFEKSWQTNKNHRDYLKQKGENPHRHQSNVQTINTTDDKDSSSNQATEGMTCPKCGSEMVKRVAKSGKRAEQAFWGCSQFPKCRGVVNIVPAAGQ